MKEMKLCYVEITILFEVHRNNNIQKRNKRVMMSNGKSELNVLSIQNHLILYQINLRV